MGKTGILDAFTIKMVMAALMLMDHLHYFLPGFPEWFHIASRVVAPVFTFFVAEGMHYTSDRLAYIKRMYLVGGVMLAMDMVFYAVFQKAPNLSIIMSLAITASIIFCVDIAVNKVRGGYPNGVASPVLWLLLAAVFFMASFIFEGAMICPVMGLIFYYLHRNRLIMCAAYIAASLMVLRAINYFGAQVWMVVAVIPIMLYNGKRGYNGLFAKYFFYIFYPAHIWVLFLVKTIFYA